MSLDTSKLGETAAGMMESLAESYEDYDVEIGAVMLVVEVGHDDWTAVTYRCSDPRLWVQTGLAHAAISAIQATKDQPDEE